MTATDRGRLSTGRVRELARRAFSLPLYPVLIALYFPTHRMSDNLTLFASDSFLRPLIIAVSVAVLALAACWAIARDRHRGAFWAMLGLVLFCFYGYFQKAFDWLTLAILGTEFSGKYLFVALLATFGAIGYFVRPGRTFSQVANLAVGVMLLPPAFGVARATIGTELFRDAVDAHAEAQRQAVFGNLPADATKPSIVHIVLDAYSRQDVLRDVYGFDNAAFIDALRERGFAVAGSATTPYPQTILAMSSIFSAQYLQDLPPERPAGTEPFRRMLSMWMEVNPVLRALSGLGYSTAAVDTVYEPVQLETADHYFSTRADELSILERVLYRQTVLFPILREVIGFQPQSRWREIDSSAYVPYAFSRNYHRRLDPPFFLYFHVNAPHPPFDVDQHGNFVPADDILGSFEHFRRPDPISRRFYRRGYVAKVRFTNTQVLAYLDRLLADVPDPKVIILHGDHGGGLFRNLEDLGLNCPRERFSVLLAVYSSDGRLQQALPDDLNLVNLYRVLFNELFETGIPPLPNRHFFATSSQPDKFESLSSAQLQRPCK